MKPFAEALRIAVESDARHEQMQSGDYVLMFVLLEWEDSRSGRRSRSSTAVAFPPGETTEQIGDRLAETLRSLAAVWRGMSNWETTACRAVHLWTDGPRLPRHAGRNLLRHGGVRRELAALKYTGCERGRVK